MRSQEDSQATLNSVNLLMELGRIFILLTERLETIVFSDFIVSLAFVDLIDSREHQLATKDNYWLLAWSKLRELETSRQMERVHKNYKLLLVLRLRLLRPRYEWVESEAAHAKTMHEPDNCDSWVSELELQSRDLIGHDPGTLCWEPPR